MPFRFLLNAATVLMLKFRLPHAPNACEILQVEVFFQGLVNHFLIRAQFSCNYSVIVVAGLNLLWFDED